ncbi:MAG TPA: hypothetical protein VKT70_07105 [Stellaceae bacterium]|nr:hypothetical protein [Stellaceae bacterium]
MPGHREFRFKIDARYTSKTMPLARLAQYLRELAVLLGEEGHIHLLKVEDGSTVPVFCVDEEAADRVRERAAEVRRGAAPIEAMGSYRTLNRMLEEDRGHASFAEGEAEIIPFPGASMEPEPQAISGIKQQGTLEGELEKIGGPKEWVPVHLRTMANEQITGCFARKSLVRELAPLIYQPVRLYGRGRWARSRDGRWEVERFLIDSFTPLSPVPLPSVVAQLRRIKSDWTAHPVASLNALRHAGEDA